MVRFTTFESYEVAVRLSLAMRGTDGVEAVRCKPVRRGGSAENSDAVVEAAQSYVSLKVEEASA